MSNLSLVLVWHYTGRDAMIFMKGGTLVTFNNPTKSLLGRLQNGKLIIGGQSLTDIMIAAYGAMPKVNRNYLRLMQLTRHKYIDAVEVISQEQLHLILSTPLSADEAAKLAEFISDLISEADVATEQSSDISTNPAWPHYAQSAS